MKENEIAILEKDFTQRINDNIICKDVDVANYLFDKKYDLSVVEAVLNTLCFYPLPG